MKRRTQLKFEDRVKLESYLEEEIPVKVICKKLGVSKQTIYREIQRNSFWRNKNNPLQIKCINDPRKCIHHISGKKCNKHCSHFIQKQCDNITR